MSGFLARQLQKAQGRRDNSSTVQKVRTFGDFDELCKNHAVGAIGNGTGIDCWGDNTHIRPVGNQIHFSELGVSLPGVNRGAYIQKTTGQGNIGTKSTSLGTKQVTIQSSTDGPSGTAIRQVTLSPGFIMNTNRVATVEVKGDGSKVVHQFILVCSPLKPNASFYKTGPDEYAAGHFQELEISYEKMTWVDPTNFKELIDGQELKNGDIFQSTTENFKTKCFVQSQLCADPKALEAVKKMISFSGMLHEHWISCYHVENMNLLAQATNFTNDYEIHGTSFTGALCCTLNYLTTNRLCIFDVAPAVGVTYTKDGQPTYAPIPSNLAGGRNLQIKPVGLFEDKLMKFLTLERVEDVSGGTTLSDYKAVMAASMIYVALQNAKEITNRKLLVAKLTNTGKTMSEQLFVSGEDMAHNGMAVGGGIIIFQTLSSVSKIERGYYPNQTRNALNKAGEVMKKHVNAAQSSEVGIFTCRVPPAHANETPEQWTDEGREICARFILQQHGVLGKGAHMQGAKDMFGFPMTFAKEYNILDQSTWAPDGLMAGIRAHYNDVNPKLGDWVVKELNKAFEKMWKDIGNRMAQWAEKFATTSIPKDQMIKALNSMIPMLFVDGNPHENHDTVAFIGQAYTLDKFGPVAYFILGHRNLKALIMNLLSPPMFQKGYSKVERRNHLLDFASANDAYYENLDDHMVEQLGLYTNQMLSETTTFGLLSTKHAGSDTPVGAHRTMTKNLVTSVMRVSNTSAPHQSDAPMQPMANTGGRRVETTAAKRINPKDRSRLERQEEAKKKRAEKRDKKGAEKLELARNIDESSGTPSDTNTETALEGRFTRSQSKQ